MNQFQKVVIAGTDEDTIGHYLGLGKDGVLLVVDKSGNVLDLHHHQVRFLVNQRADRRCLCGGAYVSGSVGGQPMEFCWRCGKTQPSDTAKTIDVRGIPAGKLVHVSASGNDANPGTMEEPKQTVAAALGTRTTNAQIAEMLEKSQWSGARFGQPSGMGQEIPTFKVCAECGADFSVNGILAHKDGCIRVGAILQLRQEH